MKRLTPEMRRTIHSAEGRNKPKPITLPKVPGRTIPEGELDLIENDGEAT